MEIEKMEYMTEQLVNAEINALIAYECWKFLTGDNNVTFMEWLKRQIPDYQPQLPDYQSMV